MNTLQFIHDHWKEIVEAGDAVVANAYAGYAFICNHGGLRTMFAKFLGPKQSTEQPQQTKTS